jgi:hypothetical protein
MPSPALLLPCNSFPALTTVSRAGQITARKPNQPDPEAGSRRAPVSDILLIATYQIEPGWACRAESGSGVGNLPQPGVAPFLVYVIGDLTRCGCCGGSCCGATAEKAHEIEAVAVLRFSERMPARLREGPFVPSQWARRASRLRK